LAATAVALSAALIVDQGIVPLARQPVERDAFYDRVWGIDPAALALPEHERILLVTGFGFARVDYTASYPLLGRHQKRVVIRLDADDIHGSTDAILRRMRGDRIRWAYVTAIPRYHRTVGRLFAAPQFTLVHGSTIVQGARLGTRRTVFRRATAGEEARGIRRYLFRLNSRRS
ncbi:MAG: hypothetical protein QOD76_1495, partial [Solirubrobacteraceae bacterium]|nr:hypothetical protein [Solirubrobacteraceae bacterium]